MRGHRNSAMPSSTARYPNKSSHGFHHSIIKWHLKRHKKLLMGVFVLMFSSSIFMINLFRLSKGITRYKSDHGFAPAQLHGVSQQIAAANAEANQQQQQQQQQPHSLRDEIVSTKRITPKIAVAAAKPAARAPPRVVGNSKNTATLPERVQRHAASPVKAGMSKDKYAFQHQEEFNQFLKAQQGIDLPPKEEEEKEKEEEEESVQGEEEEGSVEEEEEEPEEEEEEQQKPVRQKGKKAFVRQGKKAQKVEPAEEEVEQAEGEEEEEEDGETEEATTSDFKWTPTKLVMKDRVPIAKRFIPTPAEVADGLKLMTTIPVVAHLTSDEDDVLLELCELDLGPYHDTPEKYPMAKDLTQAFCEGRKGQTRKVLASEYAKDKSAGRQLHPTGFIFHESRVGSTLVANMLASVPVNLVYSEPRVPLDVIDQCELAGLSEKDTIARLRESILAMGRSDHHDHFFIKFQSITVTFMDVILKAFPETPWIFIYRDPVEVMVSNLNKGGKGSGPCTRSQSDPPQQIQEILGTNKRGAKTVSTEEYCAAHLASLCQSALHHLQASNGRGRVVGYENLNAEIQQLIIPAHFNVAMSSEEKAKMEAVSNLYSKSRDKQQDFEGDAEEKHERATKEVENAAQKHLNELWGELRRLNKDGLEVLEAQAVLREQEARVYERTGSRFFDLPYCPEEPANPPERSVVDIIKNWNPDDVSIATRHYSTLCRLDYVKDYEKATRYRDAEIPFILVNVPELEEAVKKWNTAGYLEGKLGEKKYDVEISKNNHFMYYRAAKNRKVEGWTPPTRTEKWPYKKWLEKAQMATNISVEDEHYYLRVSDPDNRVVREDMTIFKLEPGLIMKDPKESRGIHCRFGMRHVIAEAHFDASRNMIALVSGTRRWMLAHPKECAHSYLLPMGHPSGRHSEVDWSQPDLEKYPLFKEMMGHEVLLTPGEILFCPAWWIHTICNLDVNIQCNSRSGDSPIGTEDLDNCGFHMKVK